MSILCVMSLGVSGFHSMTATHLSDCSNCLTEIMTLIIAHYEGVLINRMQMHGSLIKVSRDACVNWLESTVNSDGSSKCKYLDGRHSQCCNVIYVNVLLKYSWQIPNESIYECEHVCNITHMQTHAHTHTHTHTRIVWFVICQPVLRAFYQS